MTQPINWTQFTRRIYIDCVLSKVYDAWTTSGQIEQWFLESADFTKANGDERPKDEQAQKGDAYKWKWHHWDNTGTGEVLEANGRDQLKFTFAGGTVEVTLKDVNGRTEVNLFQDGIKTDEKSCYDIFYGCSLGWSFWMVNQKAWLEHGITLNETGEIPSNGIHMVNT